MDDGLGGASLEPLLRIPECSLQRIEHRRVGKQSLKYAYHVINYSDFFHFQNTSLHR